MLAYLLSLAIVALIGLIHLPFPLQGDHAYFATVASALSKGARLYVDLWDINQPGIFLFYLAGGVAFGFTEVGLHLFELLYWLAFSIVLLMTVGRRLASPIIASLLPIFTVGAYYLLSDRAKLMKLEALAAFPIFVAAWLAYRSTTDTNRWLLVGSGVAGGLAVSFKLALAVILIPLWLLTILYLSRISERPRWITAGEVFGLVFLGSLTPIGLLVVQLARWNAVEAAVETAFVYPLRYLSEVPAAPLDRLVSSFGWLLRSYGPILLAAAAAVWFARRSSRDRLVMYLTTWFAFGLALHLLQTKSWWAYHLHMVTFPAGILAVLAINEFWTSRSSLVRARTRLAAVLAIGVFVLLLPAAVSLTERSSNLIEHGFAVEDDQRLAFQSIYSNGLYNQVSSDVAFLRASRSRAGPIFVAGDPLYYLMSGRQPAIALSGWSLEYFLADQWKTLAEQVDSALPAYVFVGREYETLIGIRGSDLSAVLDEKYDVLRVSGLGTWYESLGPSPS